MREKQKKRSQKKDLGETYGKNGYVTYGRNGSRGRTDSHLRRILEAARGSRLEDGGLDLDGGARALLLRPRTRTRHPLTTQAQTQARGAE